VGTRTKISDSRACVKAWRLPVVVEASQAEEDALAQTSRTEGYVDAATRDARGMAMWRKVENRASRTDCVLLESRQVDVG